MNYFFIDAARQKPLIPLGIQGENEATTIQFGVSAFLTKWPGAAVALTVKPPVGDTYPAVVTTENDVTEWVITSSDTASFGRGKCELFISLGSVIKKSIIFDTEIFESLKATGQAPSPVTDWITDAETELGNVQAAIADAEAAAGAIDDLTVAASGLAAGANPTATVSEVDGHKHIAFGIPAGAKGDTGATGAQGPAGQDGAAGADGTTFTPSVAANGDLSWSNDGGKQNPATVNNKGPQGETGATGQTGPAGQDGTDGVSPAVSVATITGGHSVTITDAEHPSGQTFSVLDGQAGASGAMTAETVTGSTPTITGVDNHRYVCGEVSTLAVTAPASGCIDVMFVSGSTATVLTVTSAKENTTIKWANGFDPTSLDANTTYEINILDGEWGVVGKWT